MTTSRLKKNQIEKKQMLIGTHSSNIKHKTDPEIINIRDIRKLKHLGQDKLACLAQVSVTELRSCERGLTIPNKGFFKSIGAVLDIPYAELISSHKKLHENPKSGEGYITHTRNDTFVISNKKSPRPHAKKILDLFCGTGGFSYGFEQTGKFEVVAGLDLLADRVRTFAANHEKAISYCDDITKFHPVRFIKDGIKPDVIIGGPPCQGFSSIRPYRSINDHDMRNNLFEYFVESVRFLKPEWFVLENVVGLLTHMQGKTLSRLLELFRSSGYTVSWQVLNAVHFGLPQRRERLIIVGNKNGICFEFPNPTHYFVGRSMVGKEYRQATDNHLKKPITVIDAIGDLPSLGAGEQSKKYLKNQKQRNYAYKLQKCEEKLTLHKSTMHSTRLLNIIKHAGPNIHSIPNGLVTGFSTSYSRLAPNEPSVTLTVNFVFPGSNKCIHPFQDRALTPREGARLQGFDDDYVFVGNRAQIVKQIGNAVPPILGKVMAESILRYL